VRHRGGRANLSAGGLVLGRLTPLDVSNLRIERHGLPMNVAALAILEPKALLDASGELALGAIRLGIEQRLSLAPRLRQRLYWPGVGFGAPVWVDDARFDIERHVRTRTVPAPPSEEALLATCVELNDRAFDQAHPPWEIWFLTEALDGQVSMLIRFHHVLADARPPWCCSGRCLTRRSRPQRHRAQDGRRDPCPLALSCSCTSCAHASLPSVPAWTGSRIRDRRSSEAGRCCARE